MTKIRQLLIAGLVLAAGACSFDVVNPGPVADESLDAAGAWPAIILGVRYNMSRAIAINAFYSGVAAKELGTAGRVNATKLPNTLGQLTTDDISANMWNWSHTARWTAEDGVRRLRDTLGAGFATNKYAGQLLMWASLANRMLGDNMCQAVIDGGAAQANTAHYTRAVTEATEAITIATAIGATELATRQAAYAVRAAANLGLGNYAAAGADAAAANVPTTFALTAPFDQETMNLLVFENDFAIGGTFRATTEWRTFFESYFRTTGDPRVWWDSSTVAGKARDGETTGIPWFFPRKYIVTMTAADRATPIRLTGGREARLIEAEVALRTGDFAGAATIINGLHTGIVSRNVGGGPIPNWTVTNVQEGWNALRREKSIELHLEARTMGDLRRWIADGTYQAQFTNGPDSDVADRVRLCIPMPRAERQTNTNLNLTPDDPESPIFNHTVAPW